MDKPNIITLCGSTKFKEDFRRAERRFALDDIIVLSVGFFGHADRIEIPPKTKEQLDSLHRRKIKLSDAIFVINPGGYIGDSTRREIRFAKSLGIPIYCLEKMENKEEVTK